MGRDTERFNRRNFLSFLFEGIFFLMGMAFVDINAVVPVFVFSYTSSVFLAGLASTLHHSASFVVEFLVGPYVKRIRNVPRYVAGFAFLIRPLPLLMIPILFMNISGWYKAVAFVVIYGLLRGGDGLIYLTWNDLLGRTIPSRQRGILIGYQQLFGGIAALVAGLLVKAVLDHPGLDLNQSYALIFSGSAIFLCISALALVFIRDLPHSIDKSKVSHWHFVCSFARHLRESPLLARVVTIRIFSTIAAMIAPFIILFGQDRLALSVKMVSTLVTLQIIGGLVGGLVSGYISKIYGHHRVIQISQLTGLILPLALLLLYALGESPYSGFYLIPLVMLNGFNLNNWAGFTNYTIDISPVSERTVYLLISNLSIFPFTFLPFFGGMLVEAFGYLPIFAVGAIAAAVAFWRSLSLQFTEGPPDSVSISPLPPVEF